MSTPANPTKAASAETVHQPDALDQVVFSLIAYLKTIGADVDSVVFTSFEDGETRMYFVYPVSASDDPPFKGEGVA